MRISPSKRSSRLAGAWRVVGAVCALGLLQAPAWADEPKTSSFANYIRTDFTVDDGLPDNVVDAITQTQNGLLWLGTDSGLASFDGRTFTPVRLRIPGIATKLSVNSLTEGQDGDLWAGTSVGVVRIPKLGLNDAWLTGSTAFRFGKAQNASVAILFTARDGTIWAGTSEGLYRFDGHRFVSVLPEENVSRINQAPDGRLILVTSQGLVEYDGKHIIRPNGLNPRSQLFGDYIFDAYQDPSGTTWYSTEHGLRTVQNGRMQLFHPPASQGQKVYRIFAAPNGSLWVTSPNGVYEVVGNDLLSPVPNVDTRTFYAAKDGNLWIGTNGSGLIRVQPRTIQMYTRQNALPNDIAMAVLPARDGKVWIGMNCGLAVLEEGRFRTFDQKDGLDNGCAWTLAEDHDHAIWVGTYGGGLLSFRGGRFVTYAGLKEMGSDVVTKILIAPDNSLWVLTLHGISHFQSGKVHTFTTNDGLSSDRILDMHQDSKGVLWVATQAGIDRLGSDHFTHVFDNGYADDRVPSRFFEDSKGDLFVADEPEGVSQIKDGRLILLDRTLSVLQMIETADHVMWFSSTKGILEINEDEFLRARTSRHPLDYLIFNRADGLNTTEADRGNPDIAMEPSGKLWVATGKGLAMIETSRLPRSSQQPAVFVAGVSVDGNDHVVDNALQLGPGTHHVELSLAAVDVNNPQRIRLQYRMEGIDGEWLDAPSSRVAIFTSLPAGTHRLFIRATDSLGHWSEPEVVYQVTQRPHYYETPLFLIGTAVTFLLLLALMYLWRVRYLIRQSQVILEERQVEREAIAKDLHDTFLQSVQGLVLSFHTGTQKLPEDSPVRQSFTEALKQSDRVMFEGRNVLNRLHERRIGPETLTDTFAGFGKDFRALSAAQFDLQVTGRSRALNTVALDELARIGREALFNAFRHARAHRITVNVAFGSQELCVHFSDDGIGIDPVTRSAGRVAGHYGLPNMKERAGRIRSRFELHSRPGGGTEIEIRVPGQIAYSRSDKPRNHRGIRSWFMRRVR